MLPHLSETALTVTQQFAALLKISLCIFKFSLLRCQKAALLLVSRFELPQRVVVALRAALQVDQLVFERLLLGRKSSAVALEPLFLGLHP